MIKCLLNNQILNEYVPNKSSFNKWLYAIDFKKDAELNIKIVNPEEMRNYNKIYRNINKVSDTLAFPTEKHVIENKVILGDIVMCANKINEDAIENNKKKVERWAHLTIHSALHLIGYNHDNQDEQDNMENMEIDILKKFSILNPYNF